MIPTYALLTAAVLSLWLGGEDTSTIRRFLWVVPLAASVLAGLATGILRPVALVWIAAFAALLFQFRNGAAARWRRTAAGTAVCILAAGLMAHQLPGFDNPVVISTTTFSADATPFRLRLNFDKTLVGVFILGLLHSRMTHGAQWRAMAARVWPVTAGLIGLLLFLSLASGYVRFDPKFPRESWVWIGVNLCFTCVAEEAFFRGYLQVELQRLWRGTRHGEWFALLAASLLFGLAHAGGGPAYVVLAAIAGIGYGWAYLRTGRIEASILTHFALNATHFFVLSYPALSRTG